jgi:hypothetical protein
MSRPCTLAFALNIQRSKSFIDPRQILRRHQHHDPAGNVFDLSKGVGKRRGVYEEGEWQQPRHLNHLALRAVSPELLAEFYIEVFELGRS